MKPFEQDDCSVNRNGVRVSKDAFKSMDGKKVPLIWRCDKDPFVIGTAHITDIDKDGIMADIRVTCSREDYINHYLTKPQRILRKIKKWLGIASPTEERWPWEGQNSDLSMKFKED
jgi:hypothetical protein